MHTDGEKNKDIQKGYKNYVCQYHYKIGVFSKTSKVARRPLGLRET
jgi:hypothetical protein